MAGLWACKVSHWAQAKEGMDNTREFMPPIQEPSLNPREIVEILRNPPSDLQLWLAARHCCLRMKKPCEARRGKVNVILKLKISILSNEMPCCLIPFTGVRLYIKASWVLNYVSDIILHCGHEMWDCPLREEKSSSAQKWLTNSELTCIKVPNLAASHSCE